MVEGPIGVGGIGAMLVLEDGEGMGAAGGEQMLGGEEYIINDKEPIHAGEEGVSVHRVLSMLCSRLGCARRRACLQSPATGPTRWCCLLFNCSKMQEIKEN